MLSCTCSKFKIDPPSSNLLGEAPTGEALPFSNSADRTVGAHDGQPYVIVQPARGKTDRVRKICRNINELPRIRHELKDASLRGVLEMAIGSRKDGPWRDEAVKEWNGDSVPASKERLSLLPRRKVRQLR
jgi:hypothetical protein